MQLPKSWYARALSDTERESVEHYLNAKYLANKPPTVAIASPANSTIFPEGSVVTISADAADSDGTVTQVEFSWGQLRWESIPSVPTASR